MNAIPHYWPPSPGINRRKLAVAGWLETSFEPGIANLDALSVPAPGQSGGLPPARRPLRRLCEVCDPVLFSDGILLLEVQRANIHAGRARLNVPTHFFAGQEPCGQVSSVSFLVGFDEPKRRRNPLWFS